MIAFQAAYTVEIISQCVYALASYLALLQRMAYPSPSIELAPLTEQELRLCLELVRARLDKPSQMKLMLRHVETFLFRDIPVGWRKSGERWAILKDELAYAFEDKTKRASWRKSEIVRFCLVAAQSTWRDRAWGPEYADPQVYTDFDSYVLMTERINLQFSLVKRSDSRNARRSIHNPFLSVHLANVADLFNLLMARAVSNGQLSRLCCCIKCAKWVLKSRAARRSGAVMNYMKQHPNRLDWPEFLRRLPMWPALCGNKACRDRFTNVVRGVSPFRLDDFPGMRRVGLTQRRAPNKPPLR